jgi:uncharacterized protein YdbL (DUF1318 family)
MKRESEREMLENILHMAMQSIEKNSKIVDITVEIAKLDKKIGDQVADLLDNGWTGEDIDLLLAQINKRQAFVDHKYKELESENQEKEEEFEQPAPKPTTSMNTVDFRNLTGLSRFDNL